VAVVISEDEYEADLEAARRLTALYADKAPAVSRMFARLRRDLVALGPPPAPSHCVDCGAGITAARQRRGAIYCSKRCRQRGWRRRQRDTNR